MKANIIKPMLLIIAAPLFSAVLSLFKIVPAPPNQGLASLVYLPLCMLSLPVAILIGLQKKLLGTKLLIGLVVAFLFPIFLFALLNPLWMPSSMSKCKEGVSPSPMVVRYECEDFSSDDGTYHRIFALEGFKGWPLMRMIDEE